MTTRPEPPTTRTQTADQAHEDDAPTSVAEQALSVPRGRSHYFPEMVRVETRTGSEIVPPLDQSWDSLTQLRWKAAALRVDEGVHIYVNPSESWRNGVRLSNMFGLSYRNGGYSGMDFDSCWTLINGVGLGAHLVRDEFERRGFAL